MFKVLDEACENTAEARFLPCVGFEDNYVVFQDGSIYSIPRNGTVKAYKKVKSALDRGGYEKVTLHKDNIKHYKTVHRIVAEAFILNPDNKPQVNHIDGDKTNNHISNLEWCTAKENKAHAIKNNLSSDMGAFNSATKRKLSDSQISEIRELLSNKTMMQKDIAKKYGVSKQTITLIKQGVTYNEK